MAPTITQRNTSEKKAEDYLRTSEKWWRDHYEMLERHGYRLRSRYQPGWIPSWTGTGKSPLSFEDYIPSTTDYVMAATRVADGTVVSIKRIPKASRELEIARFLSSGKEAVNHAANHCVPILDHFSDDSVPQYFFLVMPLLRRFDDPPFYTVDEVLDFIQQTLEGLKYMHERGVAHRDCAALNIMLEASSMYPHGFHPVVKMMDPSGRKLAPERRRRDSPGVKYYFIDFGISTRFPDDTNKADRLVTGIDGLDRQVPELSDHIPYDPIAVDVFILGNVYRKTFLDKYSNIPFLTDLVTSMTNKDPKDRPSAAEALAQFNRAITNQPPIALRWRLKEKEAGFVRNFFVNISSVAREGVYLTRTFINVPLTFLRR